MDEYRAVAARCLDQLQTSDEDSIHFPSDVTLPTMTLQELWAAVNKTPLVNSIEKVCINLLVAEAIMKTLQQTQAANAKEAEHDKQTMKLAFAWVVSAIRPNEDFARVWEDVQLADDTERASLLQKCKTYRLMSSLGLSILECLNSNMYLDQLSGCARVIEVLASFTGRNDPWTTEATYKRATSLIDICKARLSASEDNSLANILHYILAQGIKPSFVRNEHPSITPAGRKSVYPLPQRRLDPDLFDRVYKPWKFKDIYIMPVFTWIIDQYKTQDRPVIEAHFGFLVSPILTLIDDENIAWKARGCDLLFRLIQSLKRVESNILRRTNMDTVFQNALSPCLHAIPTTTPEDRSIHLLRVAYPALFAVIRTRYPKPLKSPPPKTASQALNRDLAKKAAQEAVLRELCLTKLIRDDIISAYKHTSSPKPSEDTSISSYPHPRLSTLLINQLTMAINEMGADTGKYLQDIIPILSPTLANPFGTAYVPLLDAAARCTREALYAGWPRIWKWRGEILDGVCKCWLQLGAEGENQDKSFTALREILKELVKLLRIVITQKTDFNSINEKIDFEAECQQLVDSDNGLKGLLIVGHLS